MIPVAQRGRDQQIGEAAVEAHGGNDGYARFARETIVSVEGRECTLLFGGDVEIVDSGA